MKFSQVAVATVCLSSSLIAFSTDCDLILRDVPGRGVGVFAGRDWFPTERIELAVGIPVPYEAIYWTQLINYCEGYNDTHALVTLGYSMLYNHIPNSEHSMVQKHMSDQEGVAEYTHIQERSIDVYFEPNAVLFAGDQIYSHYGDDWFTDRGFEEFEGDQPINSILLDSDTSKQDALDAQNHTNNLPGCVHQLTSYSNNVLRAAVDIVAGQYIEVVRAILLPHWAVAHAGAMGEFLWWKNANHTIERVSQDNIVSVEVDSRPTSKEVLTQQLFARFGSPYMVTPYNQSEMDYAVLLTGRGALYSPSDALSNGKVSARARRVANVEYDWWNAPNSGKGTTCSLAMLVSFRACRDIARGEELVVSLLSDESTSRRYPRKEFSSSCL